MVIHRNTVEIAKSVGKLCVGGDWACAHGDFGALRHIARQLEPLVTGPLHRDLVLLETACLGEPVRAGTLWFAIKDRILLQA